MSKILKWLSPAALVLGAGLLAGPASAAPVSSLAGLTEAQTTNVEQVHYRRARRCWRHRGHWHCRRSFRRYGYYAYPYYDPYPYYYGYGPTIGSSVGDATSTDTAISMDIVTSMGAAVISMVAAVIVDNTWYA